MKKYFIAGLIILLPLSVTLMLFVYFVDLFTTPFLSKMLSILTGYKIYLPFLQNQTITVIIARILIIFFLIIFIILLGAITRWFLFNYLMNITNKILSKIPFVKTVYKSLKDIFGAFMSQERKAFRYTTMVQFPSEKSYAVGYLSGYTTQEIEEKTKKQLKPIFIPTSPHPISGFLIFIEEKDEYKLDMKNEDSIRYILSCGLIIPEDKKK